MRSRLLLLGRALQFLTKFRLIFLQNKVHSPTNHVIYKPRENHTKKFFATGLNVVVLAFVCRCCCWQGDIDCGASSQADIILNYFLSNFLEFPLKISISSQPSWQAGTINANLHGGHQGEDCGQTCISRSERVGAAQAWWRL